MAKTIIRLWNGNLDPMQYLGVNNPQIRRLRDSTERKRKTLEENLDEKARELFEKYDECLYEYMSAISEQAFCDGFCIGGRIVAEALVGGDEI